ncbi:hypothetical protein J6590_004108 [Homalodisca vitripennis]|nr:hypothetical protein J6590_004108 [Homalodisca vitripennis]
MTPCMNAANELLRRVLKGVNKLNHIYGWMEILIVTINFLSPVGGLDYRASRRCREIPIIINLSPPSPPRDSPTTTDI